MCTGSLAQPADELPLRHRGFRCSSATSSDLVSGPYRDHHGLDDVRMAGHGRLDLAELDAIAPDLHLVDPAVQDGPDGRDFDAAPGRQSGSSGRALATGAS